MTRRPFSAADAKRNIQRDPLKDAVADLASGDGAGFDAVGLSGAGSESFAGSEGGGTDSQ